MYAEAVIFRIFSAENYDNRFKLLGVVEEILADIFLSHMVDSPRSGRHQVAAASRILSSRSQS